MGGILAVAELTKLREHALRLESTIHDLREKAVGASSAQVSKVFNRSR